MQRSVRLLVVAAEHLAVTLNRVLLQHQSGLVLVAGSKDNSNHSNLALASFVPEKADALASVVRDIFLPSFFHSASSELELR